MALYCDLCWEHIAEILAFCKGAVMVAHNADFDMSFIMDNVTLGCGLAFRATDWIKINVAYFHSIYDDWKEKEAYGSNTYKRTSRGVGIGADLDF